MRFKTAQPFSFQASGTGVLRCLHTAPPAAQLLLLSVHPGARGAGPPEAIGEKLGAAPEIDRHTLCSSVSPRPAMAVSPRVTNSHGHKNRRPQAAQIALMVGGDAYTLTAHSKSKSKAAYDHMWNDCIH